MKCMDTTYLCLCAYLVDGRPDREALGAIQSDPELCPKCRTCSDTDRSRQIESQRRMRSLIHRRFPRISAPRPLKDSIILKLRME